MEVAMRILDALASPLIGLGALILVVEVVRL